MEDNEQYGSGVGSGGGDTGNPDPRSGGASRKTRKEQKKPLELAILNEEDFSGKTEEKKGKRRKKSSKEIGDVADNFKLMLTAIFNMVGERNSIWQVHETEIDLIAQPAARIFNRYVSDKTEEYSDVAMLLFGIIILTAPRIILSINMKKEEESVKKGTIQRSSDTFAPKFADSIPRSDAVAF